MSAHCLFLPRLRQEGVTALFVLVAFDEPATRVQPDRQKQLFASPAESNRIPPVTWFSFNSVSIVLLPFS